VTRARQFLPELALAASCLFATQIAGAAPPPADVPPTQTAEPDKPAEPAERASPAEPPAHTESQAKSRIRHILNGPEFSPEEVYHVPAFKRGADDKPTTTPSWITALESFFRGLAELLRVGVWVVAAIAIVLLLVALHYWWRVNADRPKRVEVAVPAQVAGLDIRPESLPEDIATAARARMLAGDVIGGLSLLYRGALSALVLRFDAKIRASFTERECALAARAVLPAAGAEYFQSLTRAWVQAVYAKRSPDEATALALCDAFRPQFAAPPAVDSSMPEPAGAAA